MTVRAFLEIFWPESRVVLTETTTDRNVVGQVYQEKRGVPFMMASGLSLK